MKPLLAAALLMTPGAALLADSGDSYRSFQDQKGRSIKAVVIRATDDEVWIRRNDGRTFRLELATFSDTDQEFIQGWRESEVLQRENALEFSVRRFSDGRRDASTASHTTKIEKYGYVVTLTNRTPIDLKRLQIDYRLYVWRGSIRRTGQNRETERHMGRHQINLPAGGSKEVRTQSIPLTSSQLKSGWSYSGTNRTRSTDDLRGIWIRVKREGKVIAEFASPEKLMKDESW